MLLHAVMVRRNVVIESSLAIRKSFAVRKDAASERRGSVAVGPRYAVTLRVFAARFAPGLFGDGIVGESPRVTRCRSGSQRVRSAWDSRSADDGGCDSGAVARTDAVTAAT